MRCGEASKSGKRSVFRWWCGIEIGRIILRNIPKTSTPGDWVLFLAYYRKYLETQGLVAVTDTFDESLMSSAGQVAAANSRNATNASLIQGPKESSPLMYEAGEDLLWNQLVVEFLELRFAGFTSIALPAFIVSYIFFFGIGGFLHFYYYVNQRSTARDWKCQPDHWLPANLEIHEIVVGAFSLAIGSFLSSILACWIINDGWSTVYFDPKEYGYAWLLIQVPFIFIWQDYITYWTHRIFHWPWLYKNFHKLHHTYKQPTAFSVTAIHPVEFVWIQCIYISPMFLFPIHFAPYCLMLMYIYYHGIIDHSGITFKRKWWQPWQPDCIFHDNHHQYFHVNFGFNIEYWDKLHGTYRQKDRIYREDIFYGFGKKLDEANTEEIEKDMAERNSENPLAYTNNKLHYKLTEKDLKKLK